MRGVSFLFAALAVTVLAACGSSASTATDKASPNKPASSTTTGAASTPVVKTASDAKFGTILVDDQGKTLYTLTKDGAPVECVGQCLTFWPPLLLPAGATTATGAAGVTGLGTVAAGGGTQATVDDAPLYRFSGDTAAGATNGDGITSFGGVWHVVKADASGGAGTTSTTHADTTTTTNGYGY